MNLYHNKPHDRSLHSSNSLLPTLPSNRLKWYTIILKEPKRNIRERTTIHHATNYSNNNSFYNLLVFPDDKRKTTRKIKTERKDILSILLDPNRNMITNASIRRWRKRKYSNTNNTNRNIRNSMASLSMTQSFKKEIN